MDSTAKRLSSIHWYKELKVLNNGGVFFALFTPPNYFVQNGCVSLQKQRIPQV